MTFPLVRSVLPIPAAQSLQHAIETHVLIEYVRDRFAAHSPQDYAHSNRGGEHLYALAPSARLDRDEMRGAGELHDIGKLAVSHATLYHEGTLSATQWEEIETHAHMGALIVGALGFDRKSNTYAATSDHHVQGTGTASKNPNRRGNQPLPFLNAEQRRAAQLTAVVDVADSLLSGRSYRAGLPLILAGAVLHREFEGTPAQAYVEPTLQYFQKMQR
jgi:HD-GYP domain-containing protein (c-di-GMP phosphodiesterase class II)